MTVTSTTFAEGTWLDDLRALLNLQSGLALELEKLPRPTPGAVRPHSV